MSDQPIPPEPPTFESVTDPAPGSSSAIESGHKRNGARSWIAAGAAAAVLAGGLGYAITSREEGGSTTTAASAGASTSDPDAAGAASSGGRPGRPGGFPTGGTITGIDGSTITLASSQDDATVTVSTTGDTTFTETVIGSIGDLATGDTIMVMGATEDGTVTAERITAGDLGGQGGFRGGPGNGQMPSTGQGGEMPTPPTGGTGPDGQAFTPPTAGTITAIDGSTITLETSDGSSVKVITSSSTTVTTTEEITLADLAAGDTITAMGETSGTTVAAMTVRKGELGQMGPGGQTGPGGPMGGS